MDSNNLILNLSLKFALEIIEYSELLKNDHKYVIAEQLLKSGTAIGANIHEAQSAESKADFVHKFKIADKEAKETEYWFTLCQLSKEYPSPLTILLEDLKNLKNIVSKIIISSKKHEN